MEHSENFVMIRLWYQQHVYNIKQMRDFVEKAQITKEEFKEITGEDYDV